MCSVKVKRCKYFGTEGVCDKTKNECNREAASKRDTGIDKEFSYLKIYIDTN
jgi:hypothetical protein